MAKSSENQTKLTLYRGWLDPEHVWSPFVIKLEARLRFAGVPYKAAAGSTLKAPRGKIPYIKYPEHQLDGSDSATLGDSALIVKQLIEWDILPDINSKISPIARTQDLAIRALLEEKLYFYQFRELWIDNYYEMRDHILSGMSYPLRVAIGYILSRKAAQTLYGQGTGRFTAGEIKSFKREIWENINELLVPSKSATEGDAKPFWLLGGEGPTEADTSLFGFIAAVLASSATPESQSIVRSFPVILEYASRIHDVYFPDIVKLE